MFLKTLQLTNQDPSTRCGLNPYTCHIDMKMQDFELKNDMFLGNIDKISK